MKTFLNFCKKPLAQLASIILFVGLVILIIVSALPHGDTYVYKQTILGQYLEVNITFVDDKQLEFEFFADLYTETTNETTTLNYQIKNGVLYVSSTEEGQITTRRYGKIDNFKITMDTSNIDEVHNMMGDLELVCKPSVAVRTLSIVIIVLGAVLLAGSITIIVLSKKGIIKDNGTQTKAEEAPQTTTPQLQPINNDATTPQPQIAPASEQTAATQQPQAAPANEEAAATQPQAAPEDTNKNA